MANTAIEQIRQHLNDGQNFLLSGGAGSGKTHTLTEVLDYLYERDPKARVACITYTNVAVQEIEERTPYENLWVSTIHDFLWNSISGFQKNLQQSLSALIQEETIKLNRKSELKPDDIGDDFFVGIQVAYKDYRQIEEGIISHDDILVLANHMFKEYPKLCRILKNKYHYILVDEYQDTFRSVIEILLDFLRQDDSFSNIIGFFGDSMQSIYNGRAGDLEAYCAKNIVQNVIKDDNYRCSEAVIGLLNNIRNDITQKASGENKQGSINFLYTLGTPATMSQLKQHSSFASWNFDDPKDTKELYLTHRLIARENGFEDIFRVYGGNNERLLDEDNQDRLVKHLFKIQEIVHLYLTGQFNEFIKKTDFKLSRLSDKRDLRDRIQNVINAAQGAISDVMRVVDEERLINADERLEDFVVENQERYDEIIAMPYDQIACVYNYVKDFTPFSTQHNVKGAEFENVLVVLDNGNWNMYNFKYLFENTAGKESIIERTQKIFYVCCSRAKNNLVVYFDNPSDSALQAARNMFDDKHVIQI